MGQKVSDDKTMQLSTSMPTIAQGQEGPANVPIKDHIGAKLRALYAEVVNEPIPDHLLELMKKLDARDRES